MAGLIFHTHEKIDVDTVVHIKVFAPEEELIYVKGKLQWIKRKLGGFMDGVKS